MGGDEAKIQSALEDWWQSKYFFVCFVHAAETRVVRRYSNTAVVLCMELSRPTLSRVDIPVAGDVVASVVHLICGAGRFL